LQLRLHFDHFYFLRHGQTDCNARRIFQAPDEPLSALGLQQAARAAGLLAGEPIRSIVSSNVNRALTTAHTVSTPHGMAPVVFDGLRERNFGALIGTSSADIDWACEPEGGETLPEFVVGASNRVAHASAASVVETVGREPARTARTRRHRSTWSILGNRASRAEVGAACMVHDPLQAVDGSSGGLATLLTDSSAWTSRTTTDLGLERGLRGRGAQGLSQAGTPLPDVGKDPMPNARAS
jgi:probable phosphoglycerate mutase